MDANPWKIIVTFPETWPDEPTLAGQTITFRYPSESAAELAQRGFRLRGATT